MSLQETFIRNLKYYRKKKGLTQTELTVEIDMGLNYINGVEQGGVFPKAGRDRQDCAGSGHKALPAVRGGYAC